MMEETINISGIHIKEIPTFHGVGADGSSLERESIRRFMIRVTGSDVGEVRGAFEIDLADDAIRALAEGVASIIKQIMEEMEIL